MHNDIGEKILKEAEENGEHRQAEKCAEALKYSGNGYMPDQGKGFAHNRHAGRDRHTERKGIMNLTGERTPDYPRLPALAFYFRVSVDWLTGINGNISLDIFETKKYRKGVPVRLESISADENPA